MNTTKPTVQTLRRSLQTAAAVASAFAALSLPQVALASDTGISAGIVAAERFRAADNGSADVQISGVATAGTAAAATVLKGAEPNSAGLTADRKVANLTADRKVANLTADRRVANLTADRRAR